MLPNLIIIGAMKCGTTSLHNYLSLHPEIYMSETKEINYFSKQDIYLNGINWYETFFNTNLKVVGESSQSYSKYHVWPNTPKRIFKDLKNNIKFLYILRDPIKRIYSHYNEMQSQNCAPSSLEDYILKDLINNEIVLSSCYFKQISQFLKFYSIDKFKIVTLEELEKNRLSILNDIFDFLGVKKIKDEKLFNFNSNTSDEKKTRTNVGQFIVENKIIIKLKKKTPHRIKTFFKQKRIFQKILFKDIKRNVKLSDCTESELKKIFKKDVNKLRKLTGLEFNEWSV